MRRPVIISRSLRTTSRAPNPLVIIVVEPISMPPVARKTRCDETRCSSIIITRMTVARSGTSSVTPSSCSTPRQKAVSLMRGVR